MRLLLAAHAYERMHISLMSDHEFDQLALQIDLAVDTGFMDQWWRDNFHPCTGSWVWRHPDPAGLERRVLELQAGRESKNISQKR